MPDPILTIEDLTVEFDTEDGVVQAVTDVSYELFPGEVLGIVGESGSGKSVSMLSVLGLIPQPPGKIASGQAVFKGRDLLKMSKDELRRIRGGDMAMIFQDPMTSLNPVLTVGRQISEAIRAHNPGVKDEEAERRVIQLLSLVGVPNPEQRFHQYPHEFSGGMRQRGMIAMAIANSPSVLVADEPTTALDVTIQAQIMEVIKAAQRETHAADHPHHPRPRPRRGARRPGRRHVRRPRRRAVRRVFALQRAAPPVHARSHEQPRAAGQRAGPARADSGPAAEHDQPAAGLRVPPALHALPGPRALPHGDPGAA